VSAVGTTALLLLQAHIATPRFVAALPGSVSAGSARLRQTTYSSPQIRLVLPCRDPAAGPPSGNRWAAT